MGIETALLVATVASAGMSVVKGMEQNKQAKKQAMKAEEQANIQANQELKRANTAARIQKMQFIKGGVGAITGSPLLVMEETYNQGNENAANIRKSGASQAEMLRAQGKSALMGGIMDGFKTVGTGVLRGYDLGVLGTQSSNWADMNNGGWYSTQAQADKVAANNGITWN